jgi:hypothetical protein
MGILLLKWTNAFVFIECLNAREKFNIEQFVWHSEKPSEPQTPGSSLHNACHVRCRLFPEQPRLPS